jgi:3-methyladenine DNA glycosylase/8-oxoguanine DNA glycosylase
MRPETMISLDRQYERTLYPTAPFHFEGTVHKPSHFPSSDEQFDGQSHWQTMRFEGLILGIRLVDTGSVDNPQIGLNIYSAEVLDEKTLAQIEAEIVYRFDLLADMAAFYDACQHDSLLKPALDRWRGMRISAGVSLYEYLVITIVLQNATVRRSVQMLENLFSTYGSKACFAGHELSVFWLPDVMDAASEDDLRALKVGYRAKTFKRQAAAFVSGAFDEIALRTLPTAELKAKLLDLYGVGPASVWYLLFDVFKRYDVFEYISPWEQKIYSRLLFDQEQVDGQIILQEVEKRWGKWKMLAAHYLFEDLFWQPKNTKYPLVGRINQAIE